MRTDKRAYIKPAAQSAKTVQIGDINMGFYWTGTGFEERLAPPTPPPPASIASEPQQPVKLDDASEQPSSWRPATQDEVQQKIAEAIEKRFPLQTEVRTAESRKKNDDAGSVRFDPVQGLWTRAEKNPVLFPKSAVPPVTIAVDSPQVKAPHEGGSFFKWTSWFRTEAEKGRVVVAPLPEETAEIKLQPGRMCEDDPEVLASVATQYPAASEVHTAAEDADASRPEPSLTAAPDTDAPEAQGTIDKDILAPALARELDTDLGGAMWQTATNGRETISKVPRSGGEASHDANPSRWYVLKGVLEGAPALETSEPAGVAPVLEIFSLAGGVGKTSLVATLGRALSARGERVLLVEATPLPSMQYFFGACDCRPGVLRTFRPPVSSGDAPIRLATVDTKAHVTDSAAQGSLARDIQRWAEGASRVIVDVGTGSTATVRELSKTSPAILVPLVPDVNSVMTANAIDSFFQRQLDASGSQTKVFYVLNQFDSSLPLHLDVRSMLQERLSDRLLPFTLERTPVVSEALAEGMTIMDYVPDARITADFTNLAKWLETVLAPAKSNSSGRWSER